MVAKIRGLKSREILDSRGNPTVEVEVFLDNDLRTKASVPSGASTGEFEAIELRDGDKERYDGKGVTKACKNVREEIFPILKDFDILDQKGIDGKMLELDGTSNKGKLGANAISGVSLACARAASLVCEKPLYKYIQEAYSFKDSFSMPVPMFNILNGGKHADSGLAIQEFMIVPSGIETFSERLRCGSEIFHNFKKILSESGYSVGVGDEGGFSPRLNSIEEGLDLILTAVGNSGYVAGKDVFISIDAAANSFYNVEKNEYTITPGNINLNSEQLISLYSNWVDSYPFLSIEDCLNETDLGGWEIAKERLNLRNDNLILVADDLTVTNVRKLEEISVHNCANGIIIKFNQIGTLSETVECIKKAQDLGWKIIVSHRSGETCDNFISDLAVGAGADFIKSGSLSRGERLSKYNRLVRIEEEL